jgi:hypothetical protein
MPAVPGPSPSLPAPASGTAAAAVAAPAPSTAQPGIEVKLSKDQKAAQQREVKAQRDFEAAKKAGRAPASAYATPTTVEVPKAFAGKEAELQELLILYRAGQVSPEDYHKKRAEILARP